MPVVLREKSRTKPKDFGEVPWYMVRTDSYDDSFVMRSTWKRYFLSGLVNLVVIVVLSSVLMWILGIGLGLGWLIGVVAWAGVIGFLWSSDANLYVREIFYNPDDDTWVETLSRREHVLERREYICVNSLG